MTWAVLGLVAVFAGVGAWRGASRVVGILVAMVIAAVLCLPIGRAIEGIVSAATGVGGVLNRMVAIGIAAGAVFMVVSVAASVLARRMVARRPGLAKHDRWGGAVLGAAEGLVIAVVAMWAPLAIEPIARVQAEGGRESGAGRAVQAAASTIRGSWVGGLAEATNPMAGSELLTLAEDFAAVSRDPAAMEWFMSTDVMRRVVEMPEVRRAIEMAEADPELRAMAERGGVSVGDIRRVLESATVLRVLDETGIGAALGPVMGELSGAVRAARLRTAADDGVR